MESSVPKPDKSKPARRSRAPAAGEPAAPLHRSGAVARMLRMPVATLRVWERRYALTNTNLSPGGQRLYSAADLRRLALLKQLTDLGHAIGSLASLDMEQLHGVASTHAQALAATHAARRAAAAPARPQSAVQAWRLVVVGKALGARLQQPALLRQLGRPLELVGPFADVAQAAAALASQTHGRPADAWLVQESQLHAGWLAEFEARMPALVPARARLSGPPRIAVFYGYASDAVCETLAASGVALLREPQPDVALALWLRLWSQASAVPASGPSKTLLPASDSGPAVAPRRWSDAALADFGSLSTTVACECPKHVAELLVQLSRFEAYSAQCEQRSPQDAELHAFLGRVVADARASFEAALEQVALHEGLLLPTSAA